MAADPVDAFAAARDLFTTGLAALQAGRPAEAEQALRQSLALLPGRPSTLINLSVALLRQGRPAEALPLLDQVLQATPQDVDALGHRGAALSALQRHAEALAVFDQLLQLAPQRPEAWFHRAQTLQLLGQPADALAAYDRCLALRPDHAPAVSQRGTALRELGRLDEAAAAFEQALALGDDKGLNAYYLAALRGQAVPAQAPRAYVQGLFDDYAPEFDQHLVETLGYCAPDVLQRLLIGLARPGFDAVADLGCGTGLCGPLLRPLAGTLTGVDLSAPMLAAADQRGVYDRLQQADLLDFLAGTEDRFDLLVAADVFIYVGDLQPVLAGAARVLRPGGVLAFSVEPAAHDAAYVLQPSLRYAHGEQALRQAAAVHGLRVLRCETDTLRVDQAQAVQGCYWLLGAAGN